MAEYKMFNADVLIRDPDVTIDDLIDTIEGIVFKKETENILDVYLWLIKLIRSVLERWMKSQECTHLN